MHAAPAPARLEYQLIAFWDWTCSEEGDMIRLRPRGVSAARDETRPWAVVPNDMENSH